MADRADAVMMALAVKRSYEDLTKTVDIDAVVRWHEIPGVKDSAYSVILSRHSLIYLHQAYREALTVLRSERKKE